MTPNPPFPSSSTPAAKNPGVAIAALVLAILNLCMPCLVPIALGLSIYALVKSPEGQKGLAIGALVLTFMGVFTGGILAAIAIPNFMKFQSRAKQSECKTNLRMAYSGTRAYFAEHDAYESGFEKYGFQPTAGFYTYVGNDDATGLAVGTKAAPDAATARQLLAKYAPVGVSGECPSCAFTLGCVGNIDHDGTFDVWSISTSDRQGPSGLVPAGELYQHVDDVSDDTHDALTAAPAPAPDDTEPTVAPPVDPTTLTLDDLSLSDSTMNLLKKKKVHTVVELLKVDRRKLPQEAGDEIAEALADFGLTWGE